jgi:hypothetical protein
MKRSLDVLFLFVFISISVFLFNDDGRSVFIRATLSHPIIVWGVLGVVLTYVFPIYSEGVDFLIGRRMLPAFSEPGLFMLSSAFWKSFCMNLLFAFPMMVSHRITDTLIDRKMLFSRWPFMEVWNSVDWKNMWSLVAPSIIWFWIPAHTITFCLPSQYRIVMAAGLSICLGAILAFAKIMSRRALK